VEGLLLCAVSLRQVISFSLLLLVIRWLRSADVDRNNALGMFRLSSFGSNASGGRNRKLKGIAMTQSISHPAGARSPVLLDAAIREMLEYYSNNAWFVRDFWPANQLRVVRLLEDLRRLAPAPASVLEPGCGNGYISFLAGRLGYQVTATDSWQPEDREELFRRADVRSFPSNLNQLDPWPNLADGSIDAVLFGEVFEHLLNHPVGLLKQIHRVLRPGGLLLLTTPNPSTLANAVRVLLDRHTLWGTEDFACNPKIADGKIIDQGDIHYREYRADELRKFVTLAEFQVDFCGYIGFGSPSHEPMRKRAFKGLLRLAGLMDSRLFAGSDYIIATKR
jgi:SAM-dependent methyltransferase